jgi:hypothetical protein
MDMGKGLQVVADAANLRVCDNSPERAQYIMSGPKLPSVLVGSPALQDGAYLAYCLSHTTFI